MLVSRTRASILATAIDDLPDDNLDLAIVLTGVGLRPAPTTIKDCDGGLHTRRG
jgi:hypothetical protein